MAFAPELRDGFRIFATDALNLSADASERFADLCNRIDDGNQTYDFSAARMTAGGHSLPTIRERIDRALREGTRRVRQQRQSVDLARGQSGRSALGLPVGVPDAQRLPAPGVKTVNKGEGGGSVSNVPSSGAMASYYSPGAPAVSALPPNSGARYTQPGSNDIAPLPPTPQAPSWPEQPPQADAGVPGINPFCGKIMGPDGKMSDPGEMSSDELEAARQMHMGLGNGREVVALRWEQQRRANNTQTGPQGYA